MEESLLFPTIVLLLLGTEAGLAKIARSKGRIAPWFISVSTDPPKCASKRLNQIENLLLVIASPLGMALLLAGIGIAVMGRFTVSAYVIYAAFVLIAARPIFVAACFAFADLDDAPRAVRHT